MQVNLKLLFISFFVNCMALGFGDVDFDNSNGLDLLKKYSAKYLDPNADKELALLRENYEKLKPSKVTSSVQLIIPKKIHLIWLGNESMPDNYKYYLHTWKQLHPDWEFKIWSRDDILRENFPTKNLFLLSRSHAEQADLSRYEILYRYGGLYIDTDIECFKTFEELHYKYDFYVNMEPPALNKKRVTIANNMIGSVPGHYILAQTLNNIKENWKKNEENFEENFSNSWTSFSRSVHNLAVQRTMYPLSDAVFNFFETQNQIFYKSIVLPSGYNIPMYVVNDRPIINFLSNTFRGRAKLSNKIELRPETMSFHFYDKQNSLMTKSDFSTSLFKGKKVRGLFYKILKFRDKHYLAFRDLFNKNYPTEVSYHIEPIIPKTIYLEADNTSPETLKYLEQKWKDLNPEFIIKLISSAELQEYLPSNIKASKYGALDLIGAFYLLNKEGGVFVNSSFQPASLKEFHYKYAFYGMFNNLSKIFSKLEISTNIIAFAPKHTMLSRIIDKIEDEVAENAEIDNNVVKNIYVDKAYKFYQLDGKSIIFTESSFNQKR